LILRFACRNLSSTGSSSPDISDTGELEPVCAGLLQASGQVLLIIAISRTMPPTVWLADRQVSRYRQASREGAVLGCIPPWRSTCTLTVFTQFKG